MDNVTTNMVSHEPPSAPPHQLSNSSVDFESSFEQQKRVAPAAEHSKHDATGSQEIYEEDEHSDPDTSLPPESLSAAAAAAASLVSPKICCN